MNRRSAAFVLGTRRDAINVAPLIRLMDRSSTWRTAVCAANVDSEAFDATLAGLDIVIARDVGSTRGTWRERDLDAMVDQAAACLERYQPDVIVVHGDTLAAWASMQAAARRAIPVAHVTIEGSSLESAACPVTFVTGDGPSAAQSARPLVRPSGAHWDLPGSMMVDDVQWVLRNKPGRSMFVSTRDKILVLINQGDANRESIERVLDVITELVRDDAVEVVMPLHRWPTTRSMIDSRVGGIAAVHLTSLLEYTDYAATMLRSDLVLTDAADVTWEAMSLGKPVIATVQGMVGVPAEVLQALDGESAHDVAAKCRLVLHDDDYRQSLHERQHLATSGISAHVVELRLREHLDAWIAHDAAAKTPRPVARPREEGDR